MDRELDHENCWKHSLCSKFFFQAGFFCVCRGILSLIRLISVILWHGLVPLYRITLSLKCLLNYISLWTFSNAVKAMLFSITKSVVSSSGSCSKQIWWFVWSFKRNNQATSFSRYEHNRTIMHYFWEMFWSMILNFQTLGHMSKSILMT